MLYAMKTQLEYLKERHATLLAAVEAIEGGNQSWSSPDGMSYTRADLRTLYSELRRVENQIAALDPASTGGGFSAQTFSFASRR